MARTAARRQGAAAATGTSRPGRRPAGLRGILSQPVLLAPYVIFFGLCVPLGVIRPPGIPGGAALLPLNLCMIVMVVLAIRRSPTRAVARPWRWLAASWGLLQIVTIGFGVTGVTRPEGPPADVLVSPLLLLTVVVRGLFTLAVLAGLLALGDRIRGRTRWKVITDALTVMGAGVMAMWYLILGPALADGRQPGAVRLTTITLPITDVAMVLGVVTVLLSGSRLTSRRSILLLVAAMIGFLVQDCIFVARILHPEQTETWARMGDLVLAVPLFLLGAAAAEHCRQATAGTGAESASARLPPAPWLPQIALMAGFTMLAAVAATSGLYPWPGLVAGAIIMTFGVAARQVIAVRENRDLALTDSLTHLPNRASFTEALTHTLERGRRTGARTAVLLIDLNDFKPVNDRYGHEAGDDVLVAFAAVLRETVRRADRPARLGGDEFAVVLPDLTSHDDAVECARRIVTAMAATRVETAGQSLSLRASIGVAVVDPAEPELDGPTLVRRADDAMYVAKRARRTGWHLWTPDVVPAVPAFTAADSSVRPLYTLTGEPVAVQVLAPEDHSTDPLRWRTWLDQSSDEVRNWCDENPGTRRMICLRAPAHVPSWPAWAAAGLDWITDVGLAAEHLVLDISPLLPTPGDVVLAHLEQARTHAVRTMVDLVTADLPPVAELLDLPVDLLVAGDHLIVVRGDGHSTTTPFEAAVRMGGVISATHRNRSQRSDEKRRSGATVV